MAMRHETMGNENIFFFFFNNCIVVLNSWLSNAKSTTKIFLNELQKPISCQSCVELLNKRIENSKDIN